MQVKLECIDKFNQLNAEPKAVVIWLHGLGANNKDFIQIIPELSLKSSFKFVFPNATLRPITLNNGFIMRGWYDIKDLQNIANFVDVSGINQSLIQIEELIETQINLGFSPNKIILAGFSQGGAISYITGINTKYQLGGVLALSCYLPTMPLKLDVSVNKTTPFFAIHGIDDPIVPYQAGLLAYEELKKHGYNIKWSEYPMAHSVCLEQLVDIGCWLDSLVQ